MNSTGDELPARAPSALIRLTDTSTLRWCGSYINIHAGQMQMYWKLLAFNEFEFCSSSRVLMLVQGSVIRNPAVVAIGSKSENLHWIPRTRSRKSMCLGCVPSQQGHRAKTALKYKGLVKK